VEPGKWMRFGIVKKSYVGDDKKGRPIFRKGVVHAKVRREYTRGRAAAAARMSG